MPGGTIALLGPFHLWELVLILVLVVLLFGARRLPEAARGLARSLGAFKKGLKEGEEEEKKKEGEQEKKQDTPA